MPYLVSLLFPGLLIAAAINDIRCFKIPNRLVAVMALAWPLAAIYVGTPWTEMGLSVLMAGVILLIGILMFAKNLLGAGDVKLIAGAALWVGPAYLVPFLLYVALAGAGLAIFLMAFRKFPLPEGVLDQSWLLDLHAKHRVMPYGVAVAIGGVIVWMQTSYFSF